MKRPMIYIIIFFILGILFGYEKSFAESFIVLFLMSYSAAVLLYYKYKLNFIILLPLMSVLGFIDINIENLRPSEFIENLAKTETVVTVSGTVKDFEYYESGVSVLINSEKIHNDVENLFIEEEVLIKLYFFNNGENNNIGNNDFCYGQKISVKGTLLFPELLRNYGGFDEEHYFNINGIKYKMYPETVYLDKGEYNVGIYENIRKLRDKSKEIIKNVLPKDEAEILIAMIIGDRSGMNEYTKELFKDAGISHLIAISGLHIYIFAAGILAGFSKLHKRYGFIAAAIIVIFYCIFTGASISAVRATVMFSVLLLGKFIYRKYDLLSAISFAAFICLFENPMSLFDLSFQYSFSSVLAIAIFCPILRNVIKNKSIADVIGSTIAVSVVSKIITAYYFYTVNFVDIFINIILIPFASVIVGFGIMIVVSGFFSYTAANLFAVPVYYILKFFDKMCEMAVEIPFNRVVCGRPSTVFIVLYTVLLLSVVYYAKFHNKKFKISVSVLSVSVFAISIYTVVSVFVKEDFKLTMLDVGQGDSFVIENENSVILIDGGGNSNKEIGVGTGESVIIPYLEYNGKSHINAVFISHFDSDHMKGILDIIGKISIDKIYIPDIKSDDFLYYKLIEMADINNIDIKRIEKGDILEEGGVKFICFMPDSKNYSSSDKNGESLVFKVVYLDKSFLFTGDIGFDIENILVEKEKENISADVLKIAHHGSKYSGSEEFIDCVNPVFAIVSAGKNNVYEHPSKEVINKFLKRSIPVYNTVESGAVSITIDDSGNFNIKSMKTRSF